MLLHIVYNILKFRNCIFLFVLYNLLAKFLKFLLFSIREKLEKKQKSVMESKAATKDLETSKTKPENKLSLYKNMIGDIKFWDRCVDEIQELKKAVSKLETQMTNSGE